MILIGGSRLSVEDLPMAEVLEYLIVYDDMELNIKLKTIANKKACIKVYLNSVLESKPMMDTVKAKCVFFDTDEELLALLNAGGEELGNDLEEEDTDDENEEEVEEVAFSNESADRIAELMGEEIVEDVGLTEETLTEVNVEVEEDFLVIPNLSEDVDNLKVVISSKDKIISQKDMQIKELIKNREEMYSIQEEQLNELRVTYEAKIDEAVSEIKRLNEQVEASGMDDFTAQFIKFSTYSKNYSALLSEGLSEIEKQSLGNTQLNNVYVFTCSAGDSYFSMMKRIKTLLEKNTKVVIADFSNSPFLSTALKLNNSNRMYATHIDKEDVDIVNIVRDLGNSKVFPSQCYNDIALLGMDWGRVLKRLNDYASGYPIILLFNNFNSFSVRYTVSKLATVCPLFVFAKCNPLILSSLAIDIKFLPENRARIVATEYIDVVKQMIDVLSKKYKVIGFRENTDWKALGLKF